MKANFMEAFKVLKNGTAPDENTPPPPPPLCQALNVQTPKTEMMQVFAMMQT